MKNHIPIFSLLAILLIANSSFACFDTYLFTQRSGMTYPARAFALESNGEYIMDDPSDANADLFTGTFNLYYGMTSRFTVQGSFASAEKARDDFKFDQWGVRGVYGLVRSPSGYNLDLILEHSVLTTADTRSFELSAPSIYNQGSFTAVVHPVLAMVNDEKSGVRGHTGLFYRPIHSAIVGLGAEYESEQSSANFNNRLVKGATGTSVFFGTQIGSRLYVQQEIIKGWGVASNDVGYSLTFKYLFPQR
jgi:hypothetical protein